MKIPKDLYDETQLKVLSLNGVNFNFSKDYSNDEIADLEERIGDILLEHSESRDSVFYENLIDVFIKFQNSATHSYPRTNHSRADPKQSAPSRKKCALGNAPRDSARAGNPF